MDDLESWSPRNWRRRSIRASPRLAAAIAAKHGAASRAVLFYGSCLREKQLDGLMLDFYLIVSDYRAAYDRRWLPSRTADPAQRVPLRQDGLTAKYAVLSEADFHRLNGPETRSVSVWARFAQPSRLVWAADERRGRRRSTPSLAPRRRLLAAAMPDRRRLSEPLESVARRVCVDLLGRAAGRAQGAPGSVVDADPERYRRFTARRSPRSPLGDARRAGGGWPRRQTGGQSAVGAPARQGQRDLRRRGRLHRLEDQSPRRHQIAIKPWQRRWPLLAAISLLPRSRSPERFASPPRQRRRQPALASAPTVNGLRSSS